MSHQLCAFHELHLSGQPLITLRCRLLAISEFGPTPIRRRRLHRYLSYIAQDDDLLRKENYGATLTQSELTSALRERGMYVSFSIVRPCLVLSDTFFACSVRRKG